MPTTFASITVLAAEQPAAITWTHLRGVFRIHGMRFGRESLVVFNDLDHFGDFVTEREPEVVDEEDEAMTRILAWSALGGTEYYLEDSLVTVFTSGMREYQADVVQLAVSTTFCVRSPDFKRRFEDLVRNVHAALNAERTIYDYELCSPSPWAEELNRVRQGIFEGDYPIDLRRSGGTRKDVTKLP